MNADRNDRASGEVPAPQRDSNSWYARQSSSDEAARRAAHEILGPETEAFGDAMSQIVECLDDVTAPGPVHDLATNYKLAVTTYAFNLLWSVWDAALAGRYGPAWSLGRAVSDSCEILVALRARPELANEIESGKLKVEGARRAIRDALNSSKPGVGTGWFRQTEEGAKHLQPFAHVSVVSTKSDWALTVNQGKKVAVSRPGGALSEATLRQTAVMLAGAANQLLIYVVDAFPQLTGQRFAKEAAQRYLDDLGELQDQIAYSPGKLDAVVILSGWRHQNCDSLDLSSLEVNLP